MSFVIERWWVGLSGKFKSGVTEVESHLICLS